MKCKQFVEEAKRILSLKILYPVNELGGYGENGEVIYTAHPVGCPSVLMDETAESTVAFMSNASTEFTVKIPQGMDIPVLSGHFDAVEKRETGVPSANVWIDLSSARKRRVSSLVNPGNNRNLIASGGRIVKVGDPQRAIWYTASFTAATGAPIQTAVRHRLVQTPRGPALERDIFITNKSRTKSATAQIWTYFDMHGTQQYAYNKSIWYDTGIALSETESVVRSTVPYTDIQQIKRISSVVENAEAVQATCDYSAFVGDSSISSWMPEAVMRGTLLQEGVSGHIVTRFSTASIAANRFSVKMKPGKSAAVCQQLLYITDTAILKSADKLAASPEPYYRFISESFRRMAEFVVSQTSEDIRRNTVVIKEEKNASPEFEIKIPALPVVAHYANSLWMGVKELYEKCRAHGAELADGIELGTRDRAQDMWPKMKEDPERVRADLIYALGFMYVTGEQPPETSAIPLSLSEKLYGMYPRQYPSRWLNRNKEVYNDNRPYADSALWLVDALNMFIRETGDISILSESVSTVRLTDPDHPEKSAIIGNPLLQTVADAVVQIFSCFERHADDSPYGMVQTMYGDWCDPLDMFGTSEVGNSATRGHGRGTNIRLGAHVFDALVQTIDMFAADSIKKHLLKEKITIPLDKMKRFADRLRLNIISHAWEKGTMKSCAGFICAIHEFKHNGECPNYAAGEIGYTLGSMCGHDFDKCKRRELTSQAYGLNMLKVEWEYLTPINDRDRMISDILKTTDQLFFRDRLGLLLFSTPIPNSPKSIALVGRMGMLPPGCAENGEYHHGQMFMHRFRLGLEGEVDTAWRQFVPIISAMRDENICGPFESPCTSYVADEDDPHYGKGMYFGLSGSTDWIVEYFQAIVGLELNLHDDALPDITVHPKLPVSFKGNMTFGRLVHVAGNQGGFRKIPIEIVITPDGSKTESAQILINGKASDKAQINNVADYQKIRIEIKTEKV